MYSEIIRKRRDRKLPEDSSEWYPVPRSFRVLRKPEPTAAPLAQSLSATIVALLVHLALFGAGVAQLNEYVAVLLPLGFVSAAIGVLWLAQHRPVSTDEGSRLGARWMFFAGVLPGLLIPETIPYAFFALVPQVGAGALGGTIMAKLLQRPEEAR
jgi:hypothetical protein